jgi:two-component system, NarL family, sensor kinase
MAHLEQLLDSETYALVKQARQLKIQLDDSQAKIRRLETSISREVELGISKEKLKIGYDIHDSLGSTLAATKIQLNVLQRFLDDSPETKRAANNLAKLIDDCLEASFNMVQNMAPKILVTKGLGIAVRDYCERISTPETLFLVKDPECDSLLKPSAELNYALYKVVLEVLNNCLKHSNAKSVVVTFGFGVHVHISIVNNGSPFDFNIERMGNHAGLGISTIVKRVRDLGGTIRSEAGPPNQILISVPV